MQRIDRAVLKALLVAWGTSTKWWARSEWWLRPGGSGARDPSSIDFEQEFTADPRPGGTVWDTMQAPQDVR